MTTQSSTTDSTTTSQPLTQDELKRLVAQKALDYIEEGSILGVGTGSTVNCLIDLLPQKNLKGAVASSIATETRLKALGIPVIDLNDVTSLDVYVDGADEINADLHMIKGGGAALTREKIVASVAKTFVCVADKTKLVEVLGRFPLPIEVIPLAKESVSRDLIKLGGRPVYREGVVTDNGNIILDVHDLSITNAISLEQQINHMVGVVCNGLFAMRPANIALIAYPEEVKVLSL